MRAKLDSVIKFRSFENFTLKAGRGRDDGEGGSGIFSNGEGLNQNKDGVVFEMRVRVFLLLALNKFFLFTFSQFPFLGVISNSQQE